MSRGLLGRMAGDASTGQVEAVVEHLRVLLNARQGSSPCARGFGVVDLSDMVHSFPAGGVQLARAIKATIAEFEPRLRNVNVRHVPDEHDLQLRFEISAQLADGRSARPLRLTTTVHPGGRYDVTG